jgi:hypothetical protein
MGERSGIYIYALPNCNESETSSHLLQSLYKRMWLFSHKKPLVVCGDTSEWSKLCGFIHYNVQYVMFIVAYITIKWQVACVHISSDQHQFLFDALRYANAIFQGKQKDLSVVGDVASTCTWHPCSLYPSMCKWKKCTWMVIIPPNLLRTHNNLSRYNNPKSSLIGVHNAHDSILHWQRTICMYVVVGVSTTLSILAVGCTLISLKERWMTEETS